MRPVTNYPVRTDHRTQLGPDQLLALCRARFGSGEVEGADVVATFGALRGLKVRGENKTLRVEVAMDPKVSEDVARETVQRYNQFLEEATGYSAKERAKRLRKSAGKE
jgi:hypothetical protein